MSVSSVSGDLCRNSHTGLFVKVGAFRWTGIAVVDCFWDAELDQGDPAAGFRIVWVGNQSTENVMEQVLGKREKKKRRVGKGEKEKGGSNGDGGFKKGQIGGRLQKLIK